MHQSFAKIHLLLSQSRFELAQREIRRELVNDANNGQLHAYLALCLVPDSSKLREATDEAKCAVAHSPDEPFAHYVLALVWQARGETGYALDAIDEALRLDPENAGYFALRAQLLLNNQRYSASLSAADAGLAIDPEHVGCGNIRSMALERLGRGDEAIRATAATLAQDPDNADSHAAHGYVLLSAGRYKEAQIAFRESLRLDPDQELARTGMITALNSRSLLFRGVYKYYVWIGRLGDRAGMLLIFGAWLLMQILRSLSVSFPGIGPLVTPISIAYLLFVVMTWVATPMFNTLLRFHAFGRHLLTRSEFWASDLMAATLSLSVFSLLYAAVTRHWATGLSAAMYWFVLSVPIAATFSMLTRQRFLICAAATVLVALMPAMGLLRGIQSGGTEPLAQGVGYFYLGVLGIQIVSQVMNTRPVKL